MAEVKMKKIANDGKIYYMSGPISATDDFEERFERAEKRLNKMGIKTVNPVTLAKSLDKRLGTKPFSLSYCAYVRNDVVALSCLCDGVIMLPNWKKSRGATLELSIAQALGMEQLELSESGELTQL